MLLTQAVTQVLTQSYSLLLIDVLKAENTFHHVVLTEYDARNN